MGKGLQSIVSAWTRINRDNEEQGYPNGIPEHLLQQQQGGQVGGIQYVATGQPISQLQQHQHQLGIVGQQLGPLEARSAALPPPPPDNTSTAIAGGVISQGAIDPRQTTYKHASPQLSIHSGSSLSTFSFAAAKNNGQLTTTTHSGSIADTTLNSTPPSIREQLVQHGTSATSITSTAAQNLQPGILHQRYSNNVQLQPPPPQLLTSSTQLASQLAAAQHQLQNQQQQAQSSGANLSVSHSSKSSVSQQSHVSPTSRRRGSSSASSNSRISNRSGKFALVLILSCFI